MNCCWELYNTLIKVEQVGKMHWANLTEMARMATELTKSLGEVSQAVAAAFFEWHLSYSL